MTWQVWKFAVEPGVFTVEMPAYARVLTVQLQGKDPKVWALVDTDAPKVTHTFITVGTGHAADVAKEWNYVGSFQIVDGDIPLVFHLFHEPYMEPYVHRNGTP